MKLSSIIYNKLLLQAEEAKEHEMTKLASAIEEATFATHADRE